MKLIKNWTTRRPRTTTGALGLLALVVTLPLAFGGAALAAAPTPVLLGTAGNYAILAAAGITNTNATTITGDTGSSPTSSIASASGFQACPGFADCVSQTGTNHTDPDPNDAVTQGARSDAATAYDTAAGQAPTEILAELAGQELVAGVYRSAAGTFGMTGTLVLDGANNLDSIFIFQTGSELVTGGTGNVSLIRGAQACNVFWQIGSSATLGGGSTLVGTVLAHTTITVGSGATVRGRLLAGLKADSGAVTLIGDTITRPTTCATQADADAAAAAATAAAQAAAAATAAATLAADIASSNAAAKVLADAAAKAAAVAKAAADAAKKAATAANVKAAKAAAARAVAASKLAKAKAAAARAQVLAVQRSTSTGYAQPARNRSGFTG